MAHDEIESKDGTTIAFETAGSGPPLILVGGAFCDRTARASGTPLAALLAHRFTVWSYDRRGRGDSTDTPPYAIDREVEDLTALLGRAGGSAFVFGNSSGGFLGLAAAARGASIPKLALYEPPVILDPSRVQAFEGVATELVTATSENRRSEAVEIFLTKVMHMPDAAIEGMKKSPMWAGLERLAHTLSYDVRITARGPAHLEQGAAVRSATLILDGSASAPWMREANQRLANAIPGARHRTLEGQTHAVDIEILARELEIFFGDRAA